MRSYEYTVIPAPARGEKTKGAKPGIERFAATLSEALNDMARDGWEYVRAEVLPAEERSGLTSRSTVYHNLLVFRRALMPEPAILPRDHGAQDAPPQLATTPVPQPDPTPTATSAQPVRAPFSQPMRAMPKLVQTRAAEPPVTRPEPQAPAAGPRLGPANR